MTSKPVHYRVRGQTQSGTGEEMHDGRKQTGGRSAHAGIRLDRTEPALAPA
jgi:hypothetical protein